MTQSDGRRTATGTIDTPRGDLDPAPLMVEHPAGDAIRRFYHHYKPRLTDYASHRGADDPEGLADLAFFDGLRAAPALDQPTERAFRAYLYQALRSRMISEKRRKQLDRNDLALAQPALWRDHDPAPSVADHLLVDELLDTLTVDQRRVIQDRFLLGYSTGETADRTGKSSGAVRKLQHDALRKLRLVLAAAVILLLAATAALAVIVASSERQRIIMETPVTDPPSTSERPPAPDRSPVDEGPTGPTTTGPRPGRSNGSISVPSSSNEPALSSPAPTLDPPASSPSSSPAPPPTSTPAVEPTIPATATSSPSTTGATTTTAPPGGDDDLGDDAGDDGDDLGDDGGDD